jgi:hypothetical protein
MNCHSELDESQLVDGAEGVAHYHIMVTGSVNWAIALGRHDIQHAVSAFLHSPTSTCPTIVHMALSSLPGALASNSMSQLVLATTKLLVSNIPLVSLVWQRIVSVYAPTHSFLGKRQKNWAERQNIVRVPSRLHTQHALTSYD